MPLTERDINIPHITRTHTQTPPTRKTSQQHSKLPRFVSTPTSAPAAAKWTSRFADQTSSVERTASAMRRTPTQQRDLAGAESSQKAPKLYRSGADKPLPYDKALPPCPIARLSTEPSPSKDSRSLIDACEQPLQFISVSGEKHEWPSLKPLPSRSPSPTPPGLAQTTETAAEDTPPSSSSASASSVMAAATELTNTIVEKDSRPNRASKSSAQSLASSYVSATEHSSEVAPSYKPSRESVNSVESHAFNIRNRSFSNASTSTDLPTRQASLRSRISNGNLITPTTASKHQITTMTDFTRADMMSPASVQSRTISPSPASFSRPRPGSLSNGTPMSARSMKTASRIPIPDSKKATMVDVKKEQGTTPNMSKDTGLPTFGSRRLNSPDALKILENGKMRRQMQRTPTTASNPQLRRLKLEEDSNVRPASPLSRNTNKSPDAGQATSSIRRVSFHSDQYDEDEVPTPSDRSHCLSKSIYRNSNTTANSPATQETHFDDGLDNDRLYVARAPPQTSPFVAPLETIPSQAVLTVDANDLNDEGRDELVRTLSHLEGTGSPPKFDVDNETLLQMFGHLKKGMERKDPQNSSAFVQNAAAAEKYLAMRGSSILQVKGLGDDPRASREVNAEETQVPRNSIQASNPPKRQTMTSKWSISTPSEKAISPPSNDITGLRPPSLPKARPKSPCLQEPGSIGYPSRIPSRIAPNGTQTGDDAATIASIPSRRSSPTLSKRKPGSVRAAREGMQVSNPGFARTTAAAESRKTVRTPNPGARAFSVMDSSQRGRTISEKTRSRSEPMAAPKMPRSRSKSRYVLDKINGLFSGKRDKKSIAIPPVPRIEENVVAPKDATRSIERSPPPPPAKSSQLPKMPSLSPPAPTVPRSNSRATIRTDDTTLVDRISMKEETQCVQVLSEHLIGKARSEGNPQRKERLLTFAKVLNDSLISVREAAISAETAQHAAKSAQVSYEMTQKSLALVQRMAATVARGGSSRH